jgi:phosphatidylinositol alpha 1,6-mannosyltransferase
MAAGVPVLAAACPGPASLIDHGRTGFLVEPENSAALSEAMKALLEVAARRQPVVEAGLRTAAQFKTTAATRRLEEEVIRLLGNDRTARLPNPGQAIR